MNMKNCGCRNVSKHIDIKVIDTYITLDIFLKFGSMDKTRISYSEPKDNLGGSGKGLITSLGLKAKTRPKKLKRQGMPLEMSVRRTFQRLLGSFRNILINVMSRRGLSPGNGDRKSVVTRRYDIIAW